LTTRNTIKYNLKGNLVLERKTPSIHQNLKLNRRTCVACDICEKVCPQQAVKKTSKSILDKGKLIKIGRVELDPKKCNFCGECVILSPLNAIRIEINGTERIPVLEKDVFPNLIKDVKIDISKCDSSCKIECQNKCPTEAIEVSINTSDKHEEQRVTNINIDKQKCIYCKFCEITCPKTAITVLKPVEGITSLKQKLCPEECKICFDICPSKAIIINDEEKPEINQELCVFCGVCQLECPENAIKITRTRFLHSKVNSGAWIEASKILTSSKSSIKELASKSAKKRATVVKNIDRG
jgi:4Fe-4S ferredoxin